MDLNTCEMLVSYAESQSLSLSSQKIRKLLSTVRVHLQEGLGLVLGYREEEIAKSLQSLPLKKFVNEAPNLMELSFAKILSQITDETERTQKKKTLYNDRANLKAFLDWISLQNWKPTSPKRTSDASCRAPRTRTGKSLDQVRRGMGKNSHARKYALPKVVLEQEFPQLHQQLDLLRDYGILKAPPEGFQRQISALKPITVDAHLTRIRHFHGWVHGIHTISEQEKISAQLKVIDALTTKTKQQEQQKQNLEEHLSNLVQTVSPLQTRKKKVLAQLDDLQFELKLKRNQKLSCRKKELTTLLTQIEAGSLELILDTTLFSQFISWGINELKNSSGWAIAHCSTAIFVAKFFQDSANTFEPATLTKTIDDLRKSRQSYAKQYCSNVREGKGEKWLTIEEQDALLEHLAACTAKYDWKGKERSLTEILRSWQRYLLILFQVHYPVRVSEMSILGWGTTLKWKFNPETQREGYYCEFTAAQTKKGKPKSWFLDPDIFTAPLREWLEIWRPKASVCHNFLFFSLQGRSYGKQMTCDLISQFAKNTIFAACRDLKFTAKEDLERLRLEGKTEVEARQSLSKKHKLFIDIEPRRTNIHYWRHIGSTLIRKNKHTHAEVEAFHEIIGNTVQMGDLVYSQLELEEETAAAISWRRKLIESGIDEAALNVTADRLLGAALAILTKSQRQKLRDLGFAA